MSITENIGDRAFSVRKTRIQNEYIEKKYKVFQELNISNVSIFFIDCHSNVFLLMDITIPDTSKLVIKTPEQSFYC